ncbi:hypothetical protein [Prauserella halophila]|uniref:hypothetical protein n=1 Tax=Prauserella halophila TaxID=185641 RepID=UPI0020A2F780|nr:hypothetical protein [Prauserella halophila]
MNKVENNRIQLDRLSVINSIAVELDLSLTELLAESSIVEWSPDTGRRTVPALRNALLTYRQLIPTRGPRMSRIRRMTWWNGVASCGMPTKARASVS